jgi:transcriptional regulator with XRE-family HTH domain
MSAYPAGVTAPTFTRLFHDWFVAQGGSQAGAAVRFGTTQTTIGRWLKGESAPNIREAPRLAAGMGLDVRDVQDAIIAGREPMEAPSSPGRVRRADRLDVLAGELAELRRLWSEDAAQSRAVALASLETLRLLAAGQGIDPPAVPEPPSARRSRRRSRPAARPT